MHVQNTYFRPTAHRCMLGMEGCQQLTLPVYYMKLAHGHLSAHSQDRQGITDSMGFRPHMSRCAMR